MNALTQVAVAKAVAEKSLREVRKKVRPGHYEVDITVRIRGTMDVGRPFEQRQVNAIPWETLAKMAFDRLNHETRDLIIREVQAAQEEGNLSELLDEVDMQAKDEVFSLFETLKESTVRRVNGKITTRLVVDEVAA